MEANDDGLQAYSELLTQKNAILPFGAKISLEDLQNRLKAIIDLFAEKISLRDLTVQMIIRLEKDIRTIIIANMRKMTDEELKDSLEVSTAVFTSLYKACDELNNALDILDKKGRIPQYYIHLRKVQESVEQALRYW